MVNYKNIIVQATDQNAYRIRGNVLWFIPFILFFSIVIYILGLSVYSNWFYLSIILLTVCLNIKFQGYRILMRPYVLICLYYFVFCLFQGLLSGVKLRVALQDMYGILYFFTSYSIVLSDRFSDRCMIKNLSMIIVLLILVCCFNIFNTVFSVIQRQDQEGYRLLIFSIVGVGPGLLYCLKNNIPVKKIYAIILLFLSCLAALMSYSKQAYITVVISFIISAFLYSKNIFKTLLKLLIFGIILLGGGLFFSLLAGKISILNTISEVSLYNLYILFDKDAFLSQEDYRITEINQSIAAIKENMIFGIGFGRSYYHSGSNLDNWVHNGWLWLWLDTGLIGVILMISPFVIGVKKFIKARKHVSDSLLFLLNTSIIYVLTICINSVASPIFFRDYTSMLLLGMFTGYLNRKTYIDRLEC